MIEVAQFSIQEQFPDQASQLIIGEIHCNEQVQSIWWAPDDFHIVTAGMDGAIYEWDLETCTRSREHVIKGSTQTCVVGVHGKSKLFLSATSDCKLREMDAVEVFQVESDFNLKIQFSL